MNEELLSNIAEGFSTNNCPVPVTVNVVPQVNQVTTRIGSPVVAKTVDLSKLSGGSQNQTSFTFTNDTAQTITYWFTSLFGETGQPVSRGVSDSAADFPAAHGSGTPAENGGGDLFNFNRFILATGGAIIGKIEIVTASAGSQKNQELIVRNDFITDQQCSAPRFAPLCDTCNTTAVSDTFTATFRCPLGVGGGSSFGYPILTGQSVTFRITSIAVAVNQFAALPGSDCGSC